MNISPEMTDSTQIGVLQSDTWLTDDNCEMNEILQETINDFLSDGEEIINIQCRTEDCGTSRFWIYYKK